MQYVYMFPFSLGGLNCKEERHVSRGGPGVV
jgi:hypothetical protein